MVITDPVHLTETGYKAIATALAEEFDIPHVVHVRSLTAGPPASGSSSRGQRPTPRESWTAGTQVVAQRNANWVEKGVTRWNRRVGGNGHYRYRGAHRGRGGRAGRWTGKRSGYRPY